MGLLLPMAWLLLCCAVGPAGALWHHATVARLQELLLFLPAG